MKYTIERIVLHNSLQPMLDELITEIIKSCDKDMLVDGTLTVYNNLRDGKIDISILIQENEEVD